MILGLLAASGSEATAYVDDVFSAYTYTGNGSTQTINNGIDLAGKGGLVWIKDRTSGVYSHVLQDTNATGITKKLNSNTTDGFSNDSNAITAFNSNGFALGSSSGVNANSDSFVSWTFRKAAKFFDIVTYTGDGTSNRQIAHSLGVAPGMIIVKATSVAGQDWMVYHRSLSANGYLILNSTGAASTYPYVFDATDTDFKVASSAATNGNGTSYVAYLFAHDTSTDGIIQCGSFTTDGSGNASVNLGWEPQYIMMKSSTDGTSNWSIRDLMRGWVASGTSQALFANLSSAESNSSVINLSSTGFNAVGSTPSQTYIYLAIRRPNKPPTTGTQVYNAIARTGTGAAATVTGVGFAPDALMPQLRSVAWGSAIMDKLRAKYSNPYAYSVETDYLGNDALQTWNMDGVTVGTGSATNSSGQTYINWFFKRAPNVFDIVCYTGTGSNTTQAHNLKAAPELWLVKSRSATTGWVFGSSLLNATEYIACPSPNGRVTDATMWNSTYPTATALSLGTSTTTNTNTATFVAYLWATLAGVSKVFTYTGNGTSQNIDCGFSAGARFVMIIRATSSTAQDIFIWDSTRGIVAANDPHLSLNSNAAEVTTDDSIDPLNAGFIINQVAATNVNVNGAVYIGLAYA